MSSVATSGAVVVTRGWDRGDCASKTFRTLVISFLFTIDLAYKHEGEYILLLMDSRASLWMSCNLRHEVK